MTDEDLLKLAARWRSAVSANDMTELTALYSPSARIWTNLADRTHPLASHLSRIRQARSICSTWTYEDVRCERSGAGYVSRHRVRVTVDDEQRETVAAVFVDIVDGLIVDMHEYLTPPRVIASEIVPDDN